MKEKFSRSFFSISLAYASGLFALICVFILSAPQTRAAVGINRQMNYQAKLLDSSGSPVADGTYAIKFSLYDASSSGNRLWTAKGTTSTPTTLSVSLQNGLFTVALGDTAAGGGNQNALDTTIDWNSDSLYLGVTVAADAEMSPRKRLTAVAQAFNAENLQGMYASSSVFGTNTLFTLHQASNTAATGTRSTLDVKSKGTSNASDFLLRGINDLDSVVISVNRQGNVTSTGYLAVNGSGTSTFSGNVSTTNILASLGIITALSVGSIDGTGAAGGGTINNMSIGNTTADTGIFTNVTSTGYLAVTGSGTSTFVGSVTSSANISGYGGIFDSFLQLSGKDVCLEDGTNCQASSGTDLNWTYNLSDDFVRNTTATTDLVLGSTATSTAPFFLNLTGVSASSNRLIVGQNQHADLLVGSATSSANLAALGFELTGDDIYAEGSIASTGGFYTFGSLVAASGLGQITYGSAGIQAAANMVLDATGGYIRPLNDGSSSLGSDAFRFNGYFINVTSTDATTTNLSVTGMAFMATTTISNGPLLINGAVGGVPVTGAGTRLMWIPSKRALVAGAVSSDRFDDENVGSYALNVGYDNRAKGDYTVALGDGNIADAGNTVAIGLQNFLFGGTGLRNVGIGYRSAVGGAINTDDNTMVGNQNTASGGSATAIGDGNTAQGPNSTAIGSGNSIAAGGAGGQYAIALGRSNMMNAISGYALGTSNAVTGNSNAGAIGSNMTVTGGYSLGIGVSSTAFSLSQDNTVAIMGGNVGIGTVTPAYTLDISGTFGVSATSTLGTDLVIGGNVLASAAPSTSTLATNLSTISASGTGDYIDTAIAGNGLPVVVYFDDLTNTLNIAQCGEQACTSIVSSSTLSDLSTPESPSIAIGVDGFPVIAFHDNTNVRVIHCLNYACTSKDGPTALEAVSATTTSIAIGVDGFPIIAYRSGGADSLRVAHCLDLACGTSDITGIDTGGYFAKIAIRPNGLPVIAHYDAGNIKFRMSACTNVACTSDASIDITNVTAGSGYTSLVIGRDGIPTVLYYDDGVGANDGQLEMMRCTDMACTAFGSTSNVVTSMNDFTAGHAPWTDMILGTDGFPIIAYLQDINVGDTDPLIIHCKANDCSSVSTAVNFDADADDYTNGIALIRGTDGAPRAFYHSATITNVMRGHSCAQGLCALDGKFTGSSIGSTGKYFYRIYGRELYAQQAYLSGFDLAESYPTNDATLQAGDLLAFDPVNAGKVVRANASSTAILIGAVSTKPGLLLSEWDTDEQTVPVALTGRVPVKVSIENGSIKIGDLLAISSVPGVAAKAKGPGIVLGRALEATATGGLIEVFIQVGYDAGNILRADQQNIVLTARAEVNASTTRADSWGLTLQGNAWDGAQAISSNFTLKNNIINVTSSQFVIQNSSSTQIFALDQEGNVTIAGDVKIAGKLYPGTSHGSQEDTYLFVDDSLGPDATYLATNAAGWQTDHAFDFAERYYSPDTLETGDVVVISQRGNIHVQRSLNATDMVAGIVSTKPGFVAGRPATSTFPIALIGRVPTKISTIKGAIRSGDMLAPSTIPGVAVKALTAGPVIGQALESYDGAVVGKIEVFVHPVWWGGPTGEELNSKNQEASEATTSTENQPVHVTSTYQGFALISAGGLKVHVSYPTLQAYPNVQTTPRGQVDGGWWTDSYTDVGFDIIFKQAQTHDVTFAWRVDATAENARVYVSDGTKASIDPLTGDIRFKSVPQATTTQEQATSTPPVEIPAIEAEPVSVTSTADTTSSSTAPLEIIEPTTTSTETTTSSDLGV